MKILPLNKRVVIKPLEPERLTKSGFVIPETTNKEKPQQGEVIASFPKSVVKPGDMVLFDKYSGSEVEVEGQKYRVLPVDNLLAKLAEEA